MFYFILYIFIHLTNIRITKFCLCSFDYVFLSLLYFVSRNFPFVLFMFTIFLQVYTVHNIFCNFTLFTILPQIYTVDNMFAILHCSQYFWNFTLFIIFLQFYIAHNISAILNCSQYFCTFAMLLHNNLYWFYFWKTCVFSIHFSLFSCLIFLILSFPLSMTLHTHVYYYYHVMGLHLKSSFGFAFHHGFYKISFQIYIFWLYVCHICSSIHWEKSCFHLYLFWFLFLKLFQSSWDVLQNFKVLLLFLLSLTHLVSLLIFFSIFFFDFLYSSTSSTSSILLISFWVFLFYLFSCLCLLDLLIIHLSSLYFIFSSSPRSFILSFLSTLVFLSSNLLRLRKLSRSLTTFSILILFLLHLLFYMNLSILNMF